MINKIGVSHIKRNENQNYNKKNENKISNRKKTAAAAAVIVAAGSVCAYVAIHKKAPKKSNLHNVMQPLMLPDKGYGQAAASFSHLGKEGFAFEDLRKPILALEDKLLPGTKIYENARTNMYDEIKIINGKVFDTEGNLFEGVLKAITKSGDSFAIEYKNGEIVKSFKNGNLFKEYETSTVMKLMNEDSKESPYIILKNIKQFNKNGDMAREHYFNYGNNERLKRILTYDYENSKAYAKDISSKGAVNVYTEYASPQYPWIKKQTRYDEKGKSVIEKLKITNQGPYMRKNYVTGKEDYCCHVHPFTSNMDESSLMNFTTLKNWGKKPNFIDRIRHQVSDLLH